MTFELIAVVFALCLSHFDEAIDDVRAHHEQQLAVIEIEKLGGKVLYDYQRPDPNQPNLHNANATRKEPGQIDWVVYVSLRDRKVTNEALLHLRKFPRLENVDLSNTPISSRGLENLQDAKHLACLSLWNTKVGDVGLKYLKDKQNLCQLVLDGTKVTDEGLSQISELTNLEHWLGLTDTQITDNGLKHLNKLVKLRHLNVRRTGVTEAGVRELKASLPITDISHGP